MSPAKKKKSLFPSDVFNERVNAFIQSFYDELKERFEKRGWEWQAPVQNSDGWFHSDLDLSFPRRYRDGAIKEISALFKRLPGIVSVRGTDAKLRYEHHALISLPREYPARLSSIKFTLKTPLFHPRIRSDGRGNACVVINGDIDRVLGNITAQILMHPGEVRPPSLFPGEDYGLNHEAMKWYSRDPFRVHKRLLELWDRAHRADR